MIRLLVDLGLIEIRARLPPDRREVDGAALAGRQAHGSRV